MKRTLMLFIGLVLISGITLSQTIDEILANHIEAKGGAEKIEAIKTVKATGKMVRMNMEMKFSMWYKKPKMTRMEIVFSDKQMVFAYDGEKAWQISPFTGIEGPQVMTGDQADEIEENADMFEDPFINYREKGNKVELIGKDDLEGTEVFKVKLTKKSGKETIFYIDTESFIDLKTETTRVRGDGKEIRVESYTGDFREVNGIMTAFSIKSRINGMDMGNIIIENVTYDEAIEDSFFKMPETPVEK